MHGKTKQKKRSSQTFWVLWQIVYASGKQEHFANWSICPWTSDCARVWDSWNGSHWDRHNPLGCSHSWVWHTGSVLQCWVCFSQPHLPQPFLIPVPYLTWMLEYSLRYSQFDPKLNQRVQNLAWNNQGYKWCGQQSCWILSTSLAFSFNCWFSCEGLSVTFLPWSSSLLSLCPLQG